MARKSRRRRSSRRSSVRRTTVVRIGRRRRSFGSGGASFNLKILATQGAIAGVGIIGTDWLYGKLAPMLKLDTPSGNPKADALKQIAVRAALGAAVGYGVAKFGKMKAAGASIALASIALGAASAIQSTRGVDGLGMVNQRAADLIESGESKYRRPGPSSIPNDPQALRFPAA